MAHQDKLRSCMTGLTKVGFYRNGILQEIRHYNHLDGEWDKRVKEEEVWCNEKGCTTRFLNT